MTGFTPYFAKRLLEHGLGVAEYDMPESIWIKTHVGDPGSGTANASATTGRVEAAWGSASNDGSIQITDDLSVVSAARETVTHISGWDDETAGNCLFTAALAEGKNLYLGDTLLLPTVSVQIPVGAI